MDSSAKYGPPPPPPPASGNVPAHRIQTQLPPEAPACVQNAMMTKDKKPFTYTPGGIDLSQIRSPRMAQRISRNACMEGVTNTPKPSVNAQYNNEPQIKTTPPTPSIAASASGMPVQVFPTGPPAPPPPPKHQLAPQPPTQNGSGKTSPDRRSPSQSFEPPPLGCRPEIKIPPNPMASLKKAPKPQPKDEFWKEEYIRDRSKSPMSSNASPYNGVNEEQKPHSPPVNKSNEYKHQPQTDRDEREQSPQKYLNRVTSPPNSTSSPTAAILPRPLSPIRLQDNAQQQRQIEQQRQEQIRREQERQEQIRQRQEQILREQQKQREELLKQEQQRQEQLRRQQEQQRPEFQSQEEYEQDYQNRLAAHRREQARLAELERQETAKAQQQEQQRQEQIKLQDRRLQQQQQQQQQQPISEQQRVQFLNQRWGVPVKEKSPETEPSTQSPPPRNNALGSLYIPPVAPENLSPILQQQPQSSPSSQQWQARPRDDQEQLINQTTPIWMAPKQQIVQPEWAARDDMNGPREHIIPIQLEQTPTKTPSTPGFGPQPYFNAHQQYSSVPPPMPGYMTQDQAQQPYIHPSEQQVPEPKKYMGSAIPSRSFRILQAMTTPENAANENNLNSDNESDNSVHSNNSSSSMLEMQRYQNNPYMPPPYDPNMPPTYDPYNPYWAYYNPNNYGYMPPMYYGYPPPPPPHMMYNPYYGQQVVPSPPLYHENYQNSPVSSDKIKSSSSSEELAALTRSNTTSLSTPRIIVTPTPEDQTSQKLDELKQFTAKNGDFFSLSDSLEKVNSTFTLLSKKLSEFSAHMDNSDGKSGSNDDSGCTKNQIKKDDSLMEIDELSNDTESDESDTEVDEKKKRTSKSSIPSMHSVSNINVYKDDDDNESVITETDGEEREDDDTDVDEDVEEEEEEEEEEPEEEPNERERRYYADDIIPHQLSIIFEESEICGFPKSPLFSRRHSNASTVSDCSTTIGNDDEEESKPNKIVDNDSSVTVSFKLLSPSRSNHETPIDLPKSTKNTRDLNKSTSDNKISMYAKDSSYSSLHESNSDQEVSVTFTIPSRGNSIDRKTKSPSVEVKSNKVSQADDDSEISVSISLPLKSKSKSKTKQSKENIQAAKKNEFDTETEYETEYEIEEIYEEIIEYDKWPEDVEADTHKWEYEKVFDKSKTPSRTQVDELIEEVVQEADSDTEKELDSDDNDDNNYKPIEIKAKQSSNELSSSNDSKSLNKVEEIKLSPSPLNILNRTIESEKGLKVEKIECKHVPAKDDDDEIKLKPLPNKIIVTKLPEIKINLNTSSTPTKEIDKTSEPETSTINAPVKEEKHHEEIDIWGDTAEDELDWKTKWEMKRDKSNSEMNSYSDHSKSKVETNEPVFVPFESDDMEVVVSSTLKQFARPPTPDEDKVESVQEVINKSEKEPSFDFEWSSSPKNESPISMNSKENISSFKSEPYSPKISFNSTISPSPKIEPVLETLNTKNMEFIPLSYSPKNSFEFNRLSSPKIEEPTRNIESDSDSEYETGEEDLKDDTEVADNSIEMEFNKSEKCNKPMFKPFNIKSVLGNSSSSSETSSTAPRSYNKTPVPFGEYKAKLSQNTTPKISSPLTILEPDKKEKCTWNDHIDEPILVPEPEPEYFIVPENSERSSRIDQIKSPEPKTNCNSEDDNNSFTKSETKPIENYLLSDNLFQNIQVNETNLEDKNNKPSDILSETTKINAQEIKINVRNRIAVFEKPSSPLTTAEHKPVPNHTPKKITSDSSEISSSPRSPLSRHSSSQRSSQEESEADEEDSGVTSDMSRHISEAETESSECFPELKKMTRYQRAATHSRLFKLLQEECAEETSEQEKQVVEEQLQSVLINRPKKIVHNVSITRKQNPNALKEAETLSERRERLCLPLNQNGSIDCDSISSSGSSPTGNVVSDKLVNELVQSLLLKKKSRYLRHLPVEKLHEYARRVLLEDLDSNSIHDTFSSTEDVIPTVDSTPALTPQEFKNSYSDYYDSWDSSSDQSKQTFDILPSKAFKNLQDQQTGLRKQWSVRCPRVLSSKSVNKDLGRVTEIRESESPDPIRASSPSYKAYNMSDANSIVNNDRQVR